MNSYIIGTNGPVEMILVRKLNKLKSTCSKSMTTSVGSKMVSKILGNVLNKLYHHKLNDFYFIIYRLCNSTTLIIEHFQKKTKRKGVQVLSRTFLCRGLKYNVSALYITLIIFQNNLHIKTAAR